VTTIETYIASKGWQFKFRNGEYCLDQCPLCQAGPRHFYINQAKEVFYCQKCGERGHILSLKKRLGDLPPISHISDYSNKTKTPAKTIDLAIIEKYHKALLDNPAALSYLTEERAFNLDTIKKFRLGFNNGTIIIPHFRDVLCLNIKSRPIKPGQGPKFFREEGCPSILFNLDNAIKCEGSVIVTEGELDAVAFDQMGFPNVVAVTTGAGSFSDEWIDDLEQFDQIYLSFDMDGPGQEGAQRAADKLGRYRCLNLLLPLKDANDCLRAGFSNREMADVLAKAKRFESKLVKTPDAFFEEIRASFNGGSIDKGIPTGWEEFDGLLGGFRPNELTALTGETGSGKTTLAANLGYRMAKDGHPVLIASFEMKPVAILKKMLQMESGRPMYDHTLDSLSPFFVRLCSLPLYFVDAYGEVGIQELKDAIYYAKRRHGVEFVILDHLHFFLKYSGDHERQAIDQALKDIKTWAMQLDIHVVLIVHPTKLTYDNKVVHLNDLKGSSGLKQIPDNVLSIWRPRGENDTKSPTGEIILYLLKVRDDAGDEGKVILTFDKRSQSYSDSGPEDASSVEGGGIPHRPPRSRAPERNWANGYGQ
jgi:twinkle protein